MSGRLALCLALLIGASPAMALDLAALWDFKHPAESEQRFRRALARASGDDALILQTQIARTHGLRQDYAGAREILDAMVDRLPAAGAEVRARHALEMGRTRVSATHPAALQTPEAQRLARADYERALAIARQASLDDLAIDALHMMAFVDTAPTEQLKWGLQALAVAEGSSQPAARRWEGSLRNNVGYALHQLGRYDEALVQFDLAVRLRERGGDAEALRAAKWMVAWTQRSRGRLDEALALQLALERECDAAHAPDPEVYVELETIYRAQGNTERAEHYARLRKAP